MRKRRPIQDPGRVVSIRAESSSLFGFRQLIQRGWAGLNHSALAGSTADSSQAILFIGHTPRAWLFPHCDAVLHHGGIGTTAQAIRRSKPMLVESYHNDQRFSGNHWQRLV